MENIIHCNLDNMDIWECNDGEYYVARISDGDYDPQVFRAKRVDVKDVGSTIEPRPEEGDSVTTVKEFLEELEKHHEDSGVAIIEVSEKPFRIVDPDELSGDELAADYYFILSRDEIFLEVTAKLEVAKANGFAYETREVELFDPYIEFDNDVVSKVAQFDPLTVKSHTLDCPEKIFDNCNRKGISSPESRFDFI